MHIYDYYTQGILNYIFSNSFLESTTNLKWLIILLTILFFNQASNRKHSNLASNIYQVMLCYRHQSNGLQARIYIHGHIEQNGYNVAACVVVVDTLHLILNQISKYYCKCNLN